MKRILETVLFLVMALALTGCPPKKKPMTVEPEAPTEAESAVPPLEISDTEWAAAPAMPAVYFDYTRAELRPEARETLKKNAAVLKAILQAHPGVKVRLEGHCDERGTLEYNLALGERRAKAVRDYYATLGVAKGALSSISYGEERPVCTEADENCWWKNRRGETTLRSTAGPISIPADQLPSTLP